MREGRLLGRTFSGTSAEFKLGLDVEENSADDEAGIVPDPDLSSDDLWSEEGENLVPEAISSVASNASNADSQVSGYPIDSESAGRRIECKRTAF